MRSGLRDYRSLKENIDLNFPMCLPSGHIITTKEVGWALGIIYPILYMKPITCQF